MDEVPPPPTDRLAALVAWIEAHLDAPLTLEAIAAQAGLSPYHFSRLFTARMGRSVMAYVRARRLLRSARRLLDEPDAKVIDLAFASGFDSQEAYTRAFKRVFGVSPGRFRQGFAVTPIEGQFPMTFPEGTAARVERLPGLAHREAFTVAGFSRRFDDASKSQIPQLWSQLVGRLPFAGQAANWSTYGVVWSADREGGFQYLAGAELEAGASPPPGLETKSLPAADYLVFRITLDGSALHPQVKRAMETIWGELIPAAGEILVEGGPDFEQYDGRFEPTRAGAVIDFHVPVVGARRSG